MVNHFLVPDKETRGCDVLLREGGGVLNPLGMKKFLLRECGQGPNYWVFTCSVHFEGGYKFVFEGGRLRIIQLFPYRRLLVSRKKEGVMMYAGRGGVEEIC